ncbi:MAG: M50 family metallopeptidase [bacterium]|nr:M50 family metallopeptidase [bacterium]
MFVIIFLITLLILVVSHEFGHFISARKFGVKVLEFGFGIPPRAWGKKIGGTIYSLNWLPLGGFVRLLGEDEVDKKVLFKKDSFAVKSVWQRLVIVVAGVAMNMILAWGLFYAVLGLQGFKILYPVLQPGVYVADVENGSPAQFSGIKPGDQFVAIDNKPVESIEGTSSFIKSKPNVPLTITLANVDTQKQRQITVTPKEISPGQGRIGVGFSIIPFKQYTTLPEKILSAPSYSWDLIKLTFKGLATTISELAHQDFGKASQSVTGPVGLAVATNNIVSTGDVALYLWFMGLISLSLAAINILPFPALDGGRALFLLIEGAFGKRVNPEVERIIHTIGMAILLTLILIITYSDLRKFFF